MNKKCIYIFLFVFISSSCFCQSANTANRLGGMPSQRQNQAESNNNSNINSNNTTNQNNNLSNNKTNIFPQYDPSIDNHLVAPAEKEKSGLFGDTVFEVEETLKSLGARNYSYAFGKNSRMVLSKYMIVLNFDKNKKLGSINIKAMSPYKHVPPTAREFFMRLFLGNSDMASYSIKISSTELDISYKK